jgi:transposase
MAKTDQCTPPSCVFQPIVDAHFKPIVDGISGERGRRFRLNADDPRLRASDLDSGHAGRFFEPPCPPPGSRCDRYGQALRLHFEAGLSYAEIARAAGVDWRAAEALSDAELERRLYRPAVARASRQLEPDYAGIHQEMKRPGVTLQLLWEEYQRGQGEGGAYKYTSFCVKYRAWARGLKRSMRQTHVAGERLFVDYAGQSVAVIDAASGEVKRAQIFVAVLGASNYTYACATAGQTAADWVGSIIGALEFIGGTPRLIVPDQPRALVARPDRYEPVVGRLVEEFCDHYGVAVLPARQAQGRSGRASGRALGSGAPAQPALLQSRGARPGDWPCTR